MLFDTHAHMNDPVFDTDRDQILNDLHGQGVGLVMNPGCSLENSRQAIAIAEEYPFVYAAVGTHPDTADGFHHPNYTLNEYKMQYRVKDYCICFVASVDLTRPCY